MNYYFQAFKKYGVIEGRATRKEYWYFVLFSFIISFGLGIILAIAGASRGTMDGVSAIYNLIILVPSITLAIRRAHDVSKSGWFMLIPIYNLILAVRPSTPDANKWGPAPEGTPTPGSVVTPIEPQAPAQPAQE